MPAFLPVFSADFIEARARFSAACAGAGARVESLVNPEAGPGGEKLVTDAAWFGPPDATNVVVAISGTHGIEGLCGSGCQTAWIESGAYERLPRDSAVLFIHLINPYGVAWLQRETEEGVDLNRNFIDHERVYPRKPLYAEIHEALLCPDLEGPAFEVAQAKLDAVREEHGLMGYVGILLGGQYDEPTGMNYGGTGPTWSNRTLMAILQEHCSNATRVAVLDYHTGLGPYGHASVIVHSAADTEFAIRMCDWYGPSVSPVGSSDPDAASFIAETGKGCRTALPDAEVFPVTIEYGTYDMEREIDVVQRDLWLRNHGNRDSDIGRAIKADLLDYFYPNDVCWQELVLCRSHQVMRQAIQGLISDGN